jgi:hypothetical protein
MKCINEIQLIFLIIVLPMSSISSHLPFRLRSFNMSRPMPEVLIPTSCYNYEWYSLPTVAFIPTGKREYWARKIYSSELMTYHSTKALAPERDDLYDHAAEAFLPLGPALDLNETQHRRIAPFHFDMAYPMLRFLKESNDYLHGATGHDSALLEPESLARIGPQVNMLSTRSQHVLLWHDSVHVDTFPPGSLRISCEWATDLRRLSCSECIHTCCENCQRNCIKSGI